MNARTCQLCGKPLSRLRAEGDFCSKEHKNQYRLRAGMNRLQEANKVANLMRRRENPRQISPSRLICNSDGVARVCETSTLQSTRLQPAAVWPAFSISGNPNMPNTPQGFRDAAPDSIAGLASPRRPNSAPIRLGANKPVPALPKRRVTMSAKLMPARVSPLRSTSPEAKPRLPIERLPQGKIRVDLGHAPAFLRSSGALGIVSIHQASRTCNVRTAPRKGKALRVSTAIGFRVPAPHLREHTSKPTMRNALVWPGEPYSTTPDGAGRPAAPKPLCVAMPSAAAAVCPRGPGLARAARFIQTKTVAIPRGSPAKGTPPPAKFCGVDWNPVDPCLASTVPGPESAGFATSNGAHLFTLALWPCSLDTLHQFAAAPIHSAEGPVGYPHVAIQDTLAGAILSPGSLPPVPAGLAADMDENDPGNVVAIAPIQKRYEENFDGGWSNWSGGTAEWKMDIAGVRTGPLALFTPSVDLVDYELEFLTRIEQRTVTWVIRAANPNGYCRCTLTVLPGDELEFSRSLFFDGVAEPAVTAARRIAAKPKSTLTVRTRVQGPAFTVAVNGTTMDTWTDRRLPIGGVGFMGTPEDRARLYWIRLSTTESPGKEYRKP